MKNLKKLLALVLVLVMALGMVPFAAAASLDGLKNVDDYVDYGEIQYKEAVDVLSALGVMDGLPGDIFSPDGTFTRAQAATVIARVMLGTDVANNMAPANTGFRDVPIDHWASKYIAFCATRDIITGVGDGRFNPDAPVTAVQMAKMLLGAIGYNAHGEYDIGPGWEFEVLEKANATDIRILWFTDVTNFSAPATREEVAQYTFNALTIPRTVSWNAILNDYSSWGALQFLSPRNPTLGFRTFNLVEVFGNDGWGYRERHWRTQSGGNVNRVLTGEYPASIILGAGENGWTSTNGTTVGQLTARGAPTYKADLTTSRIVEYFYNGSLMVVAETPADWAAINIAPNNPVVFTTNAGEKTTLPAAPPLDPVTARFFRGQIVFENDAAIATAINIISSKRGVIVDFLDIEEHTEDIDTNANLFYDGRVDRVVFIDKKAAAATAATNDAAAGTVRIPGLLNNDPRDRGALNWGTSTFPGSTIYPEDLKEGDYVLYARDGRGVWHVELARSVTGRLTARGSGTIITTATFADETYNNSHLNDDGIREMWRFQNFVRVAANMEVEEVTAWLDNNGSIFAFVGETVTPNYLVLLESRGGGTTGATGAFTIDVAVLLPTGGAARVVRVASWTNAAGVRTAVGIANSQTVQTQLNTLAAGTHGASGTGPNERFGTIMQFTVDNNGNYHLFEPQNTVGTVPLRAQEMANNSQTNRSAKSSFDAGQMNVLGQGFTGRPEFIAAASQANNIFARPTPSTRSINNATGIVPFGNDQTIFLVYNVGRETASLFTGTANSPVFLSTANPPQYGEIVTFVPFNSEGGSDTRVQLVYVRGGTVETSANEVITILNADRTTIGGGGERRVSAIDHTNNTIIDGLIIPGPVWSQIEQMYGGISAPGIAPNGLTINPSLMVMVRFNADRTGIEVADALASNRYGYARNTGGPAGQANPVGQPSGSTVAIQVGGHEADDIARLAFTANAQSIWYVDDLGRAQGPYTVSEWITSGRGRVGDGVFVYANPNTGAISAITIVSRTAPFANNFTQYSATYNPVFSNAIGTTNAAARGVTTVTDMRQSNLAAALGLANHTIRLQYWVRNAAGVAVIETRLIPLVNSAGQLNTIGDNGGSTGLRFVIETGTAAGPSATPPITINDENRFLTTPGIYWLSIYFHGFRVGAIRVNVGSVLGMMAQTNPQAYQGRGLGVVAADQFRWDPDTGTLTYWNEDVTPAASATINVPVDNATRAVRAFLDSLIAGDRIQTGPGNRDRLATVNVITPGPAAGRSLVLDASLVATVDAGVTVGVVNTAGVLQAAFVGDLEIAGSGNVTLEATTLDEITGALALSGSGNVAANAALEVTAGLTVEGRTLTKNATGALLVSGGDVDIRNGGEITGAGALTINGTAPAGVLTIGPTGTLSTTNTVGANRVVINGGTISGNAGANALTAVGAVTILNGTLTGVRNITAAPGVVVEGGSIDGSHQISGSLTVRGGSVNNTAAAAVTANLTVSGGSVNMTGTVGTAANATVVDISGGTSVTIGNVLGTTASTVTISGGTSVTTGTIPGNLAVTAGATGVTVNTNNITGSLNVAAGNVTTGTVGTGGATISGGTVRTGVVAAGQPLNLNGGTLLGLASGRPISLGGGAVTLDVSHFAAGEAPGLITAVTTGRTITFIQAVDLYDDVSRPDPGPLPVVSSSAAAAGTGLRYEYTISLASSVAVASSGLGANDRVTITLSNAGTITPAITNN